MDILTVFITSKDDLIVCDDKHMYHKNSLKREDDSLSYDPIGEKVIIREKEESGEDISSKIYKVKQIFQITRERYLEALSLRKADLDKYWERYRQIERDFSIYDTSSSRLPSKLFKEKVDQIQSIPAPPTLIDRLKEINKSQ